MPIARASSHLGDVGRVSPLSFGHLELMQSDDVPTINALPALLGRLPRKIGIARAPASWPALEGVGEDRRAAGVAAG